MTTGGPGDSKDTNNSAMSELSSPKEWLDYFISQPPNQSICAMIATLVLYGEGSLAECSLCREEYILFSQGVRNAMREIIASIKECMDTAKCPHCGHHAFLPLKREGENTAADKIE